MIDEAASTRAAAAPERIAQTHPARLVAVRLANYATNEVISRIPSFSLRRTWYERVLGARMGPGAGVHLGCFIWFYGPGQVRRDGFVLGARSRINRDCCLDVRGSLEIGEDVSISPEVTILTAGHAVDDPLFRVETRPVVIEDHVWVGFRAIVMPGVRLGRGCVVAAGSVVTRDVEPCAIVAGVPARKVGERSPEATGYRLDSDLPLFE